uniref:G_PROTEIN_RECEP_F1_2 domain-containing protein n=1 Tax=Ascaris lumbricoides TaxID=6252 RepID=A0A0M3IM67_ASCLU
MEEDSWWEEHCSVIPPETLRLILVGCAGSILATVSVIFNMFLFITLVFNRTHHRSQFLYLIFLALFDTFLSASYILLFPVNLFMDFFESELLAAAWWAYMRPMLALCHVTISTSALLIVAAAFERYLTISRIKIGFHRNHRIIISLIALLFALLCKAPLFFELEVYFIIIRRMSRSTAVVANENCTGVTEHKAIVAEWTEHEPYKTVYKFWFRNVITIFLPFILLFYFNIQIVARLRRQHQGARLFRFATSEHRVVANENCTGVTEHKAIVAEWTEHEPYKTVYKFWFRNVITIFLPFILLFYFNIQIVARLRRQHQGARLFRFATSEHRMKTCNFQKNIRSATRMLVLVSCTYLASNVLNVIISAWEFIDVIAALMCECRRAKLSRGR